jgi:hypothetical protein
MKGRAAAPRPPLAARTALDVRASRVALGAARRAPRHLLDRCGVVRAFSLTAR